MKQVERPRLRRWSRGEYARLIDHGILEEDDPVELLDGLLLVKEPQHSPHRTAVLLTAKALERAFGEDWFVQTQSPIILDDRSEPAPRRRRKAAAYARAGIADYWILNLIERTLEVRREPRGSGGGHKGYVSI